MTRVKAGAASVLLLATLVSSLSIATAQDGNKDEALGVPPEKQALEDALDRARADAWRADKKSDPGRPPEDSEPAPIVGLIEGFGAPVSGFIFSAENAWCGWLDDRTYVQVWAGAPSMKQEQGMVMVAARGGSDGVWDLSTETQLRLIEVPSGRGPLRVVGVEGGIVTVRGSDGSEASVDARTMTLVE